MTFIEKAKDFAHSAHDSIKQTRKYGNKDPYWVHTDEVAQIVFDTIKPETHKDIQIVIAAHLHDVEEDVHSNGFDIISIALNFGGNVAKMVRELTDVYTSESFPMLNRKQRKELEAQRLSLISKESKLIKLADLISNTLSIVEHDTNFAKVYLKEKEFLLPFLREGNEELYQRNLIILNEAKKQLNVVDRSEEKA